MDFVSVGDLARSFQHMRQNTQLKMQMATLSQELSSGRVSDPSTAVSGDFSPLVAIERDMKVNAAFATANAEAALFTTAMQTALEQVGTSIGDLGSTLLEAGTFEDPIMLQTTTNDAYVRFESIISALNTRVADRYAFSGTSTDQKPLADAGVFISALEVAISAETSATGVETVVSAWFDDIGGGFETVGYTGSTSPLAPFRLSDSDSVQVDIIAADQEVRDILKGVAMAALIGNGALLGNPSERSKLARTAGQSMINETTTLALIRADVGSSEARIDQVSAANIAEKLSLEIARNEITAADPFKTATELEAVNLQLETLYTLTVRMSRLSLTEYLR